MNPPFTGASALKSFVRPRARNKAVLGSAVVAAFASVLSAGSAQAAVTSTTCAALAVDPSITLTVLDKTISNIVCSGDVFNNSNVLINFSVDGPIYEFSSDIIGAGTGPSTSGGISYLIAITGDQAFNSVALTAAGLDYTASKEIYSGGSLLATLGVAEETIFDADEFYTSLNIVDSWTVGGDSQFSTLEDINNLFTQKPGRVPSEVPGPLPLLGAGAAFGLSRKMRARIKASSVKL